MKIIITTTDHKNQRYPTVGDWYFEKTVTEEVLQIKVSKLSDWRREMLIAVHELVEVLLCKHDGVTQEQVDAFDMAFEKTRPEGNEDEPGDSTEAPYRRQHCIATGIERILAAELEVDWSEYEKELMNLP